MNDINVREILNEPEPLFLRPQGPDKLAAAQRVAITEKYFEAWHSEINQTNLREIPATTRKLYEQAATILCMILHQEKRVITK